MRFITAIPLLAIVLLGHLVPYNICVAQRESAGTITAFDDIQEVINKWSPERQLFVRGNIGVGDMQMRGLAEWLKANGPHWTVVLMNTAEGQRFKSQGRTYYRRRRGRNRAWPWPEQSNQLWTVGPSRDQRIGWYGVRHVLDRERVLLLCLRRARRARLGEAHWVGELDQPARRAMRSGGRIVDAVKDTVKTIDAKLKRAIESEKNAKIQIEQQRLRQVAQVQGELADLRVSVGEVEAASLEFVKEFPSATGPLAKPPTESWLEQISELEKKLSVETTSQVEQQHSILAGEISRYLNAYAARAGFKKEKEATITLVSSLDRSGSSQAQRAAAQARAMVTKGSEQLANGDLEFLETLANTESEIKLGQQALAEEQQRRRLAEMRTRWIQATALIILSTVGLVVIALLWLANRRRAATMHKATAQLASRMESIKVETDRLDKLFQRNEDILGSRENLQQRGYVGTTQQLAMRALDYVDDLFIMAKEVKRVVAEAQQLIDPSRPWQKLVNLFSASNYQTAIDHVTGAPLKFTRLTGIPLIVSRYGHRPGFRHLRIRNPR